MSGSEKKIKKEIIKFPGNNKNENTTHNNLCDTLETVPQGKFVVLSTYIKKIRKITNK